MWGGWQPNFLLNSSHVIFGRVTRTPGPSGSGPHPEKGGFCQIYLLRGFWGRGLCCIFSESGQWERNFEFWPTARENGAGRQSWPGGRPKFWNFNISYKRDPPENRAPVTFGFMQHFDPTHPEGSRGTTGSQEGVNQKSKLGYFLYKEPPLKSNCKNILFNSTF